MTFLRLAVIRNYSVEHWGALFVHGYCYMIWNRRNKVRIGEATEPVERLWLKAKNYGVKCRWTLAQSGRAQVVRLVRWNPPCRPFFKVNVDASRMEVGGGGIGCIIRDQRECCLAALAKRVPFIDNIDHLEALAAVEGVRFAKDLSCLDVVLEVDSNKVYNLLISRDSDHSAFGLLIDDIADASCDLRNFSPAWVPREANSIAHLLAQFACSFSDFEVWLEDFPPIISDALYAESLL